MAKRERSVDLPSGALAAPGAREQGRTVLGEVSANLRQLDDLVRFQLANFESAVERAVAVAALRRSMFDDLIDSLERE